MGRRLAVIFLLIVLVPLLTAAGLGLKVMRDQREMTRIAFRELLDGRLSDLASAVARTCEGIERELRDDVPDDRDFEVLRAFRRSHPLVRSAFFLAPDGTLVFPDSTDPSLSQEERAFLVRTDAIWSRRAILSDAHRPEQMERRRGGRGDSLLDLAGRRSDGWVTWYWKEGLHLLFYRQASGGGLAGVEVDRIALLSRVVGTLPELSISEGSVLLTDSRGVPVYRWGSYDLADGERPTVRRALAPPLDAWSVAFFSSAEQRQRFESGAWPVGGALGVLALVVALAGLAVYFYRESSREMREAAQRVGFVTQVSHELKTPLANIRLYAELLGEPAADERARARKLSVIVAECQRLGRLIDNILVFARARRAELPVETLPIALHESVDRVLSHFRIALDAKRIRVERRGEAPLRVIAEADKIDQILSNLVSNVEKYGAGGGFLFVELEQDGHFTRLRVGDAGAGVPPRARRHIFEPFYRASHRLADGVTGTGIGLSIARTLARACGGDLRLLERSPGAWFELKLRTEVSE